jgi:hypothetical protein
LAHLSLTVLGNFYRDGSAYTQETLLAFDHDFNRFATGIIIPHGIYDLVKNKGYINLGTSKDTSEFACDLVVQARSIRLS